MDFTRLKKGTNITIVAIVIIVTIVSSNINWGRNYWRNILESDAKGYYSYLPAIFVYQDLNFGFFDKVEKEKYYNKNTFYDYRSSFNGKVINKYYAGTALAQMPFFLIAHSLSYLSGNETDGYSKLYMIFVNIAAIFYLLIGLIFLNGILKNFELSDKNRAIILFVTVFGTNLFYYTIGESGMSHVYSFTFVTIFAFYIQQFFSTHHTKYLNYIALALGMIVFIRPINLLVLLFIPFLAGGVSVLKVGLKALVHKPLHLLLAISLFLGIAFIQLYIYKISTGFYFVYSYLDEGFDFRNPQILKMLFSYKKGLFLYTPLYFVSLFGLYYLFKKNKVLFLFWIIPFYTIVFVFSSWWNWYYGGSFSSRVFVEFIPFFMILLGLLLHFLDSKIKKWLVCSLLFFLVLICQIQTFQYRYNVIHWSEMTQEKYWDVFLKIRLK